VAGVIQGENLALPTGRFESRNESFLVETGRFIRSKEDLEGVVVGVNEQRPVYLRQVAEVTDGPTEATSYVWHGEGPGGAKVARTRESVKRILPRLTFYLSRLTKIRL
jgi:multidrug efflux pump subunit AcrB